jgi:hypothetical protein
MLIKNYMFRVEDFCTSQRLKGNNQEDVGGRIRNEIV